MRNSQGDQLNMAAVMICKQLEFRSFLTSAVFGKAIRLHRVLSKRLLSTGKASSGGNNATEYKKTILLPKTQFPLWLNSRLRPQHDRNIMQTCKFASLYEWQRLNLPGKEFVLHDGPPYANGSPHVGHAVNKVLKDIVMRNELLNGNPIHYIPGWDCHGLPIELKAVSSTEVEKKISPLKIRNKAKNFAEQAIEVQRTTFQSWGILGDWNKSCYYTFENSYVQNQLHSFYAMFEKGLIYRDLKPVHWSPSSRTALAEAELVYNKHHKSTCLIVRFQIVTPPFNVKTDKPLYALVWTTTPWTLPANEAIMYKDNIEYSAVEIENDDGCYLIADRLVPSLAQSMGKEVKIITKFLGKALKRVTYTHPFHKEEVHRFCHAEHVSDVKGTGLVHCAPGHGREDYVVGLQNSLPVVSLVDHQGNFSEAAGPELAGKHVLENGTEAVLGLLKSDILHTEELEHSYPYDWRTNKPVITLASDQWFFDCTSVKDSAIDEIASVKFFPERHYDKSMVQLVKDRPFWCISRQRIWGVPIPVLFKRESNKPIISRSLIEHYCNLIDKHGPDFWWSLPIEELCPPEIARELNVQVSEAERCGDILDIWFDSGLSWLAALKGRTADLCLEGVDQLTGWFQSSLLTSVALTGKSPYKKLFTHGFVVDDAGHKMSKSIGNVIDPQEIVLGGKIQDKQPAFGVDTLRWWVASHSVQHTNIPISIPLIKACSEVLHKLRGTLRYALGALSDFPITCVEDFPEDQMYLIDRYMLHALHSLQKEIQEMTKEHRYNFVCSKINEFVVNDVSALYFTATKDRLYCEQADSNIRRSCQFVILQILELILRSIGPIAPLLVEEAYMHHPCKPDNVTYFEHRSKHPFNIKEKWHCSSTEEILQTAFHVKKVVNKTFHSDHLVELDAVVHLSLNEFNLLKPLVENQLSSHSQLNEILQLGSVELKPLQEEENSKQEPFTCIVEATPSASAVCRRCRRYKCQEESDLCNRCDGLIHSNVLQQATL